MQCSHVCRRNLFHCFSVMSMAVCSCNGIDNTPETLFSKLPADETGVYFSNDLIYTNTLNAFTSHNFYNGGGVAIGDVNNDNLPDLFFTGNMVPNKLYLNKGNFYFEDISKKAGISSEGIWYTGVTFVDINADGLLDIYLCRANDFIVGWRGNELFINNGNLTFSEQSAKYGLVFAGFSTQSVFFDLDNDSDLDCYLLNSSKGSASNQYYPSADQRKVLIPDASRLFLNENDHFKDITASSGIFGNKLELGLGVSISDINKDGWQDLYVSNDFFERDYLYINNHDTTFTECLEKYIPEISMFSMGADIADINNDTYPDIYVTDMLPEKESRLKSKTNFESWERYQYTVNKGYHHQFLRNVLQINRGPLLNHEHGGEEYYFSEIGRLAGVHATDWSWGALLADFNNDGHKDIFVSNGMYKDVTDQDFIQFMANDSLSVRRNWKELIDLLPSEPLPKYAFENNGDLTFTNRSVEWGFDTPTFSNGSAYADLDNDGDLDLVTNNINAAAGIYRNNSQQHFPDNRYLKFVLEGEGKNLFGIGTKVTAYYNNTLSFVEQFPSRGFQSCVDHKLHMGVGKALMVDSLRIEWPDRRMQILKNVKTNQTLILKQEQATLNQEIKKLRTDVMFVANKPAGIHYVHHEDELVDFNEDKLIYYMLSTAGPKIAVADINADSLDDIYLCGAKGQAGEMYLQQPAYGFKKTNAAIFELDKDNEDTECLFFDADNDKDQDLFVCSGGNIISTTSGSLTNRLYLNNGKGNFSLSKNLPQAVVQYNTSTASSADYDGDGDNDLFVGSRSQSGKYGYLCNGQLLANNGKGLFTDVTASVAPGLINTGMITCSQWVDYDLDKKTDLVIAGEYMPVRIFHNEGDHLKEVTEIAGLAKTNGWWSTLAVTDVNHDSFPDLIIGNHGLNSRFKGTKDHPVSLMTADFDNNGSVEQILCTYNEGKEYPMVLRHDLVGIIPSLKKRFLKYADYKEKTLAEIFTGETLSRAVRQEAFEFRTCLFINNKKGGFEIKPLPIESQFSPVYAIAAKDFDRDGHVDILLGGNFFQSKPEAGIHKGSYGEYLKGDGLGNFKAVPLLHSGFFVTGAIRDLEVLLIGKKQIVVVAKNNEDLEFFEVKSSYFENRK
jgi:enediyne biosynthesis protein E4